MQLLIQSKRSCQLPRRHGVELTMIIARNHVEIMIREPVQPFIAIL